MGYVPCRIFPKRPKCWHIWSLKKERNVNMIQLYVSLKNSFLEVKDCCNCVRRVRFFEELCSLLLLCSTLCTVAWRVILWKIQYFCCQPDTLWFYCRLWKNHLFLPTKVILMPERIQPVSQHYCLCRHELNSLNCSYTTEITLKMPGEECRLLGWSIISRERAGDSTVVQKKSINILRELPILQVTLMTRIT